MVTKYPIVHPSNICANRIRNGVKESNRKTTRAASDLIPISQFSIISELKKTYTDGRERGPESPATTNKNIQIPSNDDYETAIIKHFRNHIKLN